MQIIGHKLVKSEPLCHVKFIDSSLKDKAILFDFNDTMIEKAKKLEINFSLICKNESEAILANAVGAKFIVCEKNIAKNLSELANFYMFDSKIACVIKNDTELTELANLHVDTAIFQDGVIYGAF